jgi:hypothetical protein
LKPFDPKWGPTDCRRRRTLKIFIVAAGFVVGELIGAAGFTLHLQNYSSQLTFRPATPLDYVNLGYLALFVVVVPVCIAKVSSRMFDAYFDS